MTDRTIILAINGINTFPGDEKDWNLRLDVWVDQNYPANVRCHPIQYLCGPIDRAFGQKDRCAKLQQLLGEYEDWNKVVIGHSNGAAVAIEGLRLAGWPRIEKLHLVSAACEASFNKNGLNAALRDGRIGKVVVYVSGKDMALRLASQPLARLLGYGILGLRGPVNVNPVLGPGRVTTMDDGPWLGYGHSGCFEDSEFDATARLLTE